ncbi:cob(I)yrinic acid a,c-diamide adenosyltransferase [Candidatus Woesearchaeota archaeon]|nr:cob(I)yrinic acid a,c-diamide adenosyltransferase [Candidatus Woesearchaeota archaeon]
MRKRGLVYIFTGDGEGKTTAALGLGLRAIGHGKTVVVIQFMKGRKHVGEYQVQKLLKNYEVYQFGKEQFVDLKHPDKEDFELAKQGLEFVKQIIKKRPDVLILDEINIAVDTGLLKLDDVLEIIRSIPKEMVVILTGRNASKKLIKEADVVSYIKDIKHIFNYGVFARKSEQY